MTSPPELESFFKRYGEALAIGDLETVADSYACPSLVLGGPEIILVSTRDDVISAFAGAAESHRRDGFTRADASVTVIDDGAADVSWVAVDWVYSSDDGSKTQNDAYRYLVRRAGGSYSVAALAPAPLSTG